MSGSHVNVVLECDDSNALPQKRSQASFNKLKANSSSPRVSEQLPKAPGSPNSWRAHATNSRQPASLTIHTISSMDPSSTFGSVLEKRVKRSRIQAEQRLRGLLRYLSYCLLLFREAFINRCFLGVNHSFYIFRSCLIRPDI